MLEHRCSNQKCGKLYNCDEENHSQCNPHCPKCAKIMAEINKKMGSSIED